MNRMNRAKKCKGRECDVTASFHFQRASFRFLESGTNNRDVNDNGASMAAGDSLHLVDCIEGTSKGTIRIYPQSQPLRAT
jgi:hypothetical protein